MPFIGTKYSGEPRLIESELKTNLGSDNFIFVQNMSDLFANSIPTSIIRKIVGYCMLYNNKYLFHTKNPEGYRCYTNLLDKDMVVLGVTIETNRDEMYNDAISHAPKFSERYLDFLDIDLRGYTKMLSIEPIMDCDVDVMLEWARDIKPAFVSIGADSKNRGVREPDGVKIKELINKLKSFTEVKIKDNLLRLIPE
jgi:DNA repair photolyase